MSVWGGIDPGARETGVVVREGTNLLAWALFDLKQINPRTAQLDDDSFAVILNGIRALTCGSPVQWAVERVVAPSPWIRGKKRFINPDALLVTSQLVGRLAAALPGIVLVTPAGHGQQPLSTYPPSLISTQEWGNAIRKRATHKPAPMNGKLRHARAAWNIAGAGPVSKRLADAAKENHR